jgi:phenylacetic acid degradation operon negative regulatory protein
MKPRTELLLYQLEWTLDKMLRPTWRNLDSSFESWAYGSGLLRQIQRLEAQAFIESRRDAKSGLRVIRLTDKGLSAGRMGTDPVQRWQRPWDGMWRMVLFDLPEADRSLRGKLRYKLFAEGFGCLQRSAWISPNPMNALAAEIRSLAVNAANLVLLNATPCGGEYSSDMVRAAWDFKHINQAWKTLAEHLDSVPHVSKKLEKADFANWVGKERNLLQRCFRLDPFLPNDLLPADYQGMKTWQKRRQVLEKLTHNLALNHALPRQPS